MDQGIFKAAFMRIIANLSPWVVPLIRVVKLWARTSGLNDPTAGTLNSYCLTLMSIFHLQQLSVPQLPPIWLLLPVSEASSSPAAGMDAEVSEHLPGPASVDSACAEEASAEPVCAESECAESSSADSASGEEEPASGEAYQPGDIQSQQDRLAEVMTCSEQCLDKPHESKGEQQPDEDLRARQRPHSANRIMHKGARQPADTIEKIQRNASLWRSTLAPLPQPMSLDTVVLAFFVRLSAFLLARYRRFDDSCWRTMSTWSGALAPCQIQKLKQPKAKRGSATKSIQRDSMTDDTDQATLLHELLCTLRQHWGKSGGCARACSAATARVLELAPLMVPHDAVAALREEFAAAASTRATAEESSESREKGARLNSGGRSGATAEPEVGRWKEYSTATRKRMLEEVCQFLLRVPRSKRCSERAAGGKKGVVDASPDDSATDHHDQQDRQSEELSWSGAGEAGGTRGGTQGGARPALAGEHHALPSKKQPLESQPEAQARNHTLEAKENDLILDFSSSGEDGDAQEAGAAHGTAPEAETSKDSSKAASKEGDAARDESAAAMFSKVADENVPNQDVPVPDTSTMREVVSAPVCAEVGSPADLPEAGGLSEELAAVLRLPTSAESGAAAQHAPEEGFKGDDPGQNTGASGAVLCTSGKGTGVFVAGFGAIAPPSAEGSGGESSAPDAHKAPVATEPGTPSTTSTNFSGKRSQQARVKPTALFSVAVSSIHRNSSLPSAAQGLNGSAAQNLHENIAEGRSAEDRLRTVCQQRLATLGSFLGVEDPFDESDNAARTLRHFDRLLAHALLPVIHGADALAYCLRNPPRAARPAHADQIALDDVRHACNVMQRFEHPIRPGSEEQNKIDILANKWGKGTPGASKIYSNQDNAISKKLSQAHNDALKRCEEHSDALNHCGIDGGESDHVRGHVRGRTESMRHNQNGMAADRDPRGHTTPNRHGNRGPPVRFQDQDAFPTLSPSHPRGIATRAHPHRPSSWRQQRQGAHFDRPPLPSPYPAGVAMWQEQQPPPRQLAYVPTSHKGSDPMIFQLPAGYPLPTQGHPSGQPVQVLHQQHVIQQHGPIMDEPRPAQFLTPAQSAQSGSHRSEGTSVSVQELFNSSPSYAPQGYGPPSHAPPGHAPHGRGHVPSSHAPPAPGQLALAVHAQQPQKQQQM